MKRQAISRREFVERAGLSAAAGVFAANLVAGGQSPANAQEAAVPTAMESLRMLQDGNERFAVGKPSSPRRAPADFQRLAEGQSPFAVIVSCADSRVAPEILFDVGKGDIFVVRVAGNVIDGAGAAVKGSIEYAIAELNVPLIMVLGHTNCGAVKAAMKHLDAKDSLPGAINGLVELIKPAVTTSKSESGDPLENAIRRNVVQGVERLKGLGPIIAPRVAEGKVNVVGGVYDLRSGKVTLLS
jgi:carbonic anhydrase